MPPAAGMPQDFHLVTLPFYYPNRRVLKVRSFRSAADREYSCMYYEKAESGITPTSIQQWRGVKSAALSKQPGRLPIPRAWRLRNGRSESYPRLFVSSLGHRRPTCDTPVLGARSLCFCSPCLLGVRLQLRNRGGIGRLDALEFLHICI